jgi:hypothetical protein
MMYKSPRRTTNIDRSTASEVWKSMTLTVVIGEQASGESSLLDGQEHRCMWSHFCRFSVAGKTTFLNDATRWEKSVYIRQHHSLRPDITVSRIPNFDPSKLPFWNTYEDNGTASTVKVGGFMSGRYTGMYEVPLNVSCFPSLFLLNIHLIVAYRGPDYGSAKAATV